MLRRVKNARKAFDGSWHKIALSKKENNAKLLLDYPKWKKLKEGEKPVRLKLGGIFLIQRVLFLIKLQMLVVTEVRQVPKYEPEQGAAGPKGTAAVPGSPGLISLPEAVGLPFPETHVIEVCERMFLEQTSTFADSMRKKCASSCALYRNMPMGSPGPRDIPGYPGQKVSVVKMEIKGPEVLD
ncbi:LOW QUALITY PROTEIN: uncharacterized protein ACIBXB_020465 [Morphnus guianensis]